MGLIDKMLKTYHGDRWSRDKIEAVQKKRLQAKHDLLEFFESKGLNVDVSLSDDPPKANKISGKFKHIYREFE